MRVRERGGQTKNYRDRTGGWAFQKGGGGGGGGAGGPHFFTLREVLKSSGFL